MHPSFGYFFRKAKSIILKGNVMEISPLSGRPMTHIIFFAVEEGSFDI